MKNITKFQHNKPQCLFAINEHDQKWSCYLGLSLNNLICFAKLNQFFFKRIRKIDEYFINSFDFLYHSDDKELFKKIKSYFISGGFEVEVQKHINIGINDKFSINNEFRYFVPSDSLELLTESEVTCLEKFNKLNFEDKCVDSLTPQLYGKVYDSYRENDGELMPLMSSGSLRSK